MRPIRRFLYEMPVMNADTLGKRLVTQKYKKPSDFTHNGISHYDDNYDIHHIKQDNGRFGSLHQFHVVHKDSGDVHLKLQTHTADGVAHRVSDLAGSRDNKLKTEHLYKHLLKSGTVKQLYSDYTHSPGAKKVWERFSKLPGIRMRMFKRGREIPLNKNNWGSNYKDMDALFHATYEEN